ncbi:hypothetical protein KP509_14G017400 [Ceratopteris richardii]|nr:hypothetical protein KP509_14G017400 [Ceratopteris richardii]
MKELPRSSPSFVKPMLQSHTTGGFWLGLPSSFCKTYLPKKDGTVVLENEKGDEWDTVYLANKTGLSGGWRGFSLDHGLVDGDALVFELIEHCRFKVHIVRAPEEARNVGNAKPDSTEECDGESETPHTGKPTKRKTKAVKDTMSQKTKSSKKSLRKGSKASETESEESDSQPEKQGESGSKRKLDDDEEIDNLFKIEEETAETNIRPSAASITAYMRTGKPRYGRVTKKAMTCDVISVCS